MEKSDRTKDVEEEANADEERIDIGRALPAIKIHPVDEDAEIEFVHCLIKWRDSNGVSMWGYRTSKEPNKEELLGILTTQVDILRRELAAEWFE